MSWENKYPLDYSASGDDIDTFAQKYISEITAIYSLLNRLRRLDASAGSTVDDAEAFQLKVNQTTNDIMIRAADNASWIILGKMAANFGILPSSIGAIKNVAGATSISVGLFANRPIAASSTEGDMYFTFEGDFYYFTNGAWILLLSLDVKKLTNYSTLINQDMVSVTNAPNKILKTDTNGKLDCDIKGNAQGLVTFPLDISGVGDGKVIAYSSANGKLYFEVPGATSGGGSAIGVIAGRESSKSYSVGEKAYSSRLPSGTYLTCVTQGITDQFQPDYNTLVNGKVIDGTVEWRKDTLTGLNIQFTSDIPTNQLDGDLLINTTSVSADGGKNAILKVKSGTEYKNIYIESDNRELIESTGYGIISGLQVQAQAIPNATIRVTYGIAHMPNGKRYEVDVVPSITPLAADNTGTRKDLIYLSVLGVVSYLAGMLTNAAVPGQRAYTVTANFATGNTLTIGAVKLTAGTDFAVGSTITDTVTNIVAALNANTTITDTYTVSSNNGVTFTLTEKTAGGGNNPPTAAYTGVGVVSSGTAITSAIAIFADPVLPNNSLSLAMLTFAAKQTTITAENIMNTRIIKTNTAEMIELHNVDPNAHVDKVKKSGDIMTGNLEVPSLSIGGENISPAMSFRNKLINGNFTIRQRGVSQTVSGYGSTDRWFFNSAGTAFSASTQDFAFGQTDVPANPFRFQRVVVNSVAGAANFSSFQQRIENVHSVSGKLTLSFWAKADSAKNIAIDFYQNFGTGGSASVGGIGVTTISLTTTWKKYTVTITLPSLSGKTIGTYSYLALRFWLDAGSSFNLFTNSLGQQSGTFDFSQIQLEEGTVATPFEERHLGLELLLCQRYYETGNVFGVSYAASSVCVQRAVGRFTVWKLRPPAIVLTYITGGGTSPVPTSISLDMFAVGFTATAASQEILCSYTAESEL